MSSDVRYQRKCYYAKPEYASSFWGKFGYIYQGKGSLRLTADSLCLDGCGDDFQAPFHTIKSVGLGQFSTWAKPLGLSRLIVTYLRDGEAQTIYLVPYESIFDSTPATSKLVESWYDSLTRVEALSGRIEPPEVALKSPLPASALIAGSATAFIVFAVVLNLFLFRR